MTSLRAPVSLLMAVAVAAPPGLCGALYPQRGSVNNADVVLLLALFVVGVASQGSRAAGVVAALSSAVWFNFFLTEPYLSFTIADGDDIVTAVLLLLVGVAVTEVALWGRRQQARASGRAGYLDGVVAAAGMAAAGTVPPASVLDFVARQVVDVLGVESCDYVAGAPGGAHPILGRDGSVSLDGRVIRVERSGLPTDDVVELPVESGGVVHGRFVLTSAARTVWPDREQCRVAVALADQAGSSAAQVSRAG